MQLVREKTIRTLQRKSLNQSSLESLHAISHGINNELRNSITSIDPSHSGHVSFDELTLQLKNFTGDSEILFDLISSEIDISKGTSVYYIDFLPQISRLLEVNCFFANLACFLSIIRYFSEIVRKMADIATSQLTNTIYMHQCLLIASIRPTSIK